MNEDLVIKKVIKLEEDMAYVKEEVKHLSKKMDNFENGQDKMISILERLDQERILTEHTLKNIEKDVDAHDDDIKKIKIQLKIA